MIASAIAGALTLGLVWSERYEIARFSAAAAVACVTIGWAFAQSPYLLPDQLTLEQAAAGDATLTATLIAHRSGNAGADPSLYLLYSLTLKGQARPGVRAPGPALSAALGRRPGRRSGEPGRKAALLGLAFALGVGLMVPFEEWYTRVLGVAFLLAFIVGGAFAIAEPGFLSAEDD